MSDAEVNPFSLRPALPDKPLSIRERAMEFAISAHRPLSPGQDDPSKLVEAARKIEAYLRGDEAS